MSDECDKCGEHCLDCLCKEYVQLIPFKEDRMICPECQHIFPKLRLPLLTICPSCPNEILANKIGNQNEPEIIINGENVGPGCAITIRVAIE